MEEGSNKMEGYSLMAKKGETKHTQCLTALLSYSLLVLIMSADTHYKERYTLLVAACASMDHYSVPQNLKYLPMLLGGVH